MVMMRGANVDMAVRESPSVLAISPRMCMRPARACSSALTMISELIPVTLMSICSAVMPLAVPATLKSMSP